MVKLAQILALSLVGANVCLATALPQRHLSKRTNGTGYVHFPLTRKSEKDLELEGTYQTGTTLTRRGDISGQLWYEKYYYLIYLGLGSDQQGIYVELDSGSTDLWVPTTNSTCVECSWFPYFYDNQTSTTFESLGQSFSILYGGNDTANGTFVRDEVSFYDGPTISNVTFGAVNSSTRPMGTLGVSFHYLETNAKYETFIEALKRSGLTEKNAYSLYFNDDDDGESNILFGGIDNAKYSGELVTFPVTTQRLAINLDTITTNNGTVFKANFTANLDSGSADIYLPQDIFFDVGSQIGTYNASLNLFFVPCLLPSDKFLSFKFGPITIDVPYSDLVFPFDSNTCYLAVQSSVDIYDLTLLGVNFLKHAYTVYDLDDRKISIAPVIHTNDTSITVIT